MCSNEREPLGTLRDAVAVLAAEDVEGLPVAALAASLPELRRLVDSVEAQWLRRLETFDRHGGATAEGAVSTGSWLRSTCRLAPGAARDGVDLARALAGLPETAAALAAGDISPTHARLVAAAVAELAEAASAELAAQTEPALVDLARAVDPRRLRQELAHVRHAVAPDAAADDAERAYERRGLSASQTLDGVVALDGLLDPEGGALLLAALQPLAAPTGDDDRRTPRQRRADALVELARRQLDHGDLPTMGGERPHMTVLVPLDTLLHQPGTPPAESGAHHTARASAAPADPTQPPAAGTGPTAHPAAAPSPDPAVTPATCAAGSEPADNAGASTAPSSESDASATVPATAATAADVADVGEPAGDAGAVAVPGLRPVAPDGGSAAPATSADAADVGEPAGDAGAVAVPGLRPVAPDGGSAAPSGATAVPSPAVPRPPGPPVGGSRAAAPGGGARWPSGLPAFGPRAAESGWAGPITGEAARRIACDAGITRVITDGPSQPLDVGRRTRTVPPALRTALVVRDRGCVFPGCDRPPPWTDAHHLVHWADGGVTSLDNLALLCRRHHRTVHERRWQLTRNPDGSWVATPPGRASPPGPLAA